MLAAGTWDCTLNRACMHACTQTTSSSPRASAVLRWATLAGLFLLPMLRLRLVARGHRISPGMLVALLLLDGACMVLAYGHYAANDAGAACAASEPLSMRRLHHGAADDAEAAACSDDDDDDDDAVGEPGDGRGCWSFALETAAVVLNVMLTAWVQW